MLLVRSVTPVNSELLKGTPVKYVGTATSGTDHICQKDLQELGIQFKSAPGCNARSVVEYVIAVLVASGRDFNAQQYGIVGCGQVGGRLYRLLKSLGCNVRCFDPFLDKDDISDLTTLEEVMSSEVVCLHAPLTNDGAFPTRGMVAADELTRLPQDALLISAGRGGVIDETSLLDFSAKRTDVDIVLDVWEGEPLVRSDLSDACLYMTPHIAGYSELAKLRGAQMILKPLSGANTEEANFESRVVRGLEVGSWQQAVLALFDPRQATSRTRSLIGDKAGFDQLRKSFGSRLEFSQVSVQNGGKQTSVTGKLGFALP